MSFNFLEVQKAIQELTEKVCVAGAVVKRVSLVNFALPRPVVDLNLGFELELRDGVSKWLVFCLQNPYTGVFLTDPARIRALHPSEWGKAFHGSQPWGELIVGGKIESISVVHNERVVEIDFFKKVKLTLELFPARPNWILKFEDTTLSWREG